MSKARDLINAHLYPVLATFAVIYGAIQIAPIAQQARHFNACVDSQIQDGRGWAPEEKAAARARRTAICNGR
ncbi:hypothetical protein OAZ24_04985 [Synechococcus sp. AH-736-G21]|nr:hypothetical protein [Synechococcus sp. AH-736-G21]